MLGNRHLSPFARVREKDPDGLGEDYPDAGYVCGKHHVGCIKVFGFIFFAVLFVIIMGLNAWAVADRIDADGLRLRVQLVREVGHAGRLLDLLDRDKGLEDLMAMDQEAEGYATRAKSAADRISSALGLAVSCSESSSGRVWFRTHESHFASGGWGSLSAAHASLSFDGYGADTFRWAGRSLARASKRRGKRFGGGVVCSVAEL